MTKTTISLAIPLAIMASTLTADAKEGVDDRPMVFVHIENHAAVPPEIVADAREQLAHIFDAAGVRVESPGAAWPARRPATACRPPRW